MNVKEVKLIKYRNYSNVEVEFSKGLNVIVGKNAQGKTNLMEAIYLCCIGKSPRTNKEKDLINWEENTAKISVLVEKQAGEGSIEIILDKQNKKTVKINGIPIKKISELLGQLNVIYFSPDELKLIKETPQDRRRFMDIDISQASKNYFYLLQTYERVLDQRNKLLKNTRSIEILKDTISIWNEQLASAASKIIFTRIRFLGKLQPYVVKAHDYLTGNDEKIAISYQGTEGSSSEEIKDILLKLYDKNLQKDWELGYTTVGPHRDDIKITVNNIDIKVFGSQGQQRTAALSLKLAEVDIFKEELKETPVLLLDDVLSELDDNRKQRLINYTKGTQTIITCTKFDLKSDNINMIRVEKGSIL